MLCTLFAIWCVASPPSPPSGAILLLGLRQMTPAHNRRTAVLEFPDGRRISYRPDTVKFVWCNQASDTEQDDDCGNADE